MLIWLRAHIHQLNFDLLNEFVHECFDSLDWYNALRQKADIVENWQESMHQN